MERANIERINALYRKSKAEGLTAAEKAEQETLRREYLAGIRKSCKRQLDQIKFID